MTIAAFIALGIVVAAVAVDAIRRRKPPGPRSGAQKITVDLTRR